MKSPPHSHAFPLQTGHEKLFVMQSQRQSSRLQPLLVVLVVVVVVLLEDVVVVVLLEDVVVVLLVLDVVVVVVVDPPPWPVPPWAVPPTPPPPWPLVVVFDVVPVPVSSVPSPVGDAQAHTLRPPRASPRTRMPYRFIAPPPFTLPGIGRPPGKEKPRLDPDHRGAPRDAGPECAE
jgi:hypothetical protein